MIHTVVPIRVRYAETDRMDVVYHGNYFAWFETARIHMLDEIGLPYTEVEAEGFFIPVLEADARYIKPARFDDRLEVHLRMTERPRARFRFAYEVRRPSADSNGSGKDADLLATGRTVHGFMDTKGRPLRPPPHFMEKIDAAWGAAG